MAYWLTLECGKAHAEVPLDVASADGGGGFSVRGALPHLGTLTDAEVSGVVAQAVRLLNDDYRSGYLQCKYGPFVRFALRYVEVSR
jgi:hypothetical protein